MTNLAAKLNLPDREGIPDAIYRFMVGLDAPDQVLFESAWHKDTVFILDDRPPVHGLQDLVKTTFQFIGQGLDTTHFASNVRVDHQEGGTTAKLTTHAMAQHYRKGEGRNPKAERFLAGSMYWVDLTKDESDGLWKITKFTMKVIWCEGEGSIVGF